VAKQIEELLVKLGIEGMEGLDKLSSSFRNLQKALGPTDKAIASARNEVLEFANSGKQSIQMIQGQIDAFKGLQSQATIGGNVYRQLAGDVNALSDQLKALKKDYEGVGRAAQQTDKQIAAQFPARKPEAFRIQLAALNRQLNQLSVSARAYGDALTEITIREIAFGRAQSRQRVIAGAQAVGAPLIGAMTPQQELPNTLAALRQKIAELSQDFQNLDRESTAYGETAKELSRLQKELAEATADTGRSQKDEIRLRIENLKAIRQENEKIREQAAIRRSIERGRARGAVAPTIERPMRPISGLFQTITDIGMSNVTREIEMMGRSYTQVADDIRRATGASNNSISSLQRQRSAWQTLRNQLDPTSKSFRDVTKEIANVERRLDRFQSRQRKPMGAMGATQAAGAVISGGIFGGPEGAIGGVAGTIAGGVPGAFAGAAIGAQLGNIRKSLGEMAEFTAEIDKQRIALRNVVGSTAEYDRSLQIIENTSRRLSIPQDILTKQFTQLSASVIGAGGNVDAAERAFLGIAAGIRGTGGSLQDLQGALLATSQVFGKGKVSAEELRRQIGDRLPGAFNLFAQAIGTTTPELDKMLAQGKVDLNDFMKFTEALIKRFGSTAEEVASSSQAAGDRLATTMARLRENIGRELQPLGAEFQELIIGIFTENEEAIVEFAKNLATVTKSLADLTIAIGPTTAKIALFFAGLNIAKAAIAGIQGAFVGLMAAKTAGGVVITGTTAKVGLLSGALTKLKLATLALATAWAAPLILTVAVVGVAKVLSDLARVRAARDEIEEIQRDSNDLEVNFRNAMRGASTPEERRPILIQQMEDVGEEIIKNKKRVEDLRKEVGELGAASAAVAGGRFTLPAPGSMSGDRAGEIIQLGAAKEELKAAESALNLTKERQKIIGRELGRVGTGPGRTDARFPSADDPAGAGAGADKAGRASQVPQLMIALELQKQLSGIQDRIRDAQDAGNNLLQIRLRGEEQLLQIRSQISLAQIEEIPQEETALKIAALRLRLEQTRAQTEFELNQAFKQNIENATKAIDDLNVGYMNQVRQQRRIKEFMENGINPQLAEQLYLIERAVEISGQGLTRELISLQQQQELTQDLQTKLNLQERILEIEERLAQLRGDSVSAIEAARELYDPPDPTNFERVKEAIKETREVLDQLVDPVNQLISAAGAIGDAFADSFKGLITGSMSAKEALRNFFSSLADYFADMAAKMIAQWIRLALLNQIVKLFPGGDAAGAGGGAGGGAAGNAIVQGLSAMPGFANGGRPPVGRASLVGERGPELFVPTQAGQIVPTEVLAAAAATRQALRVPFANGAQPTATQEGGNVPFQAATSALTVPFQAMNASETGSASMAGDGLIRFETVVINGMEFVTRQEAEKIGQVAASRGAELAQKRLRNNPSARRAVGLA